MLLEGFKLLCIALQFYCLIASGLGQRQLQRLVEEWEAVDLFNCFLCAFLAVKHNESLALGLQVGLGDNIDHIAKLGEYRTERVGKRFDLDPLFEVLRINTTNQNQLFAITITCRSAMTRTW